jgi:hypothetical protein
MTYGEFDSGLADPSSTLRDHTAAFASLFVGFHPQRQPVLWRTLLAQSHLYRALMLSFEASNGAVVAPAAALSSDDARLFDWRPPDSEVSFEDAVEGPLGAVRRFLHARLPVPPSVASQHSR